MTTLREDAEVVRLSTEAIAYQGWYQQLQPAGTVEPIALHAKTQRDSFHGPWNSLSQSVPPGPLSQRRVFVRGNCDSNLCIQAELFAISPQYPVEDYQIEHICERIQQPVVKWDFSRSTVDAIRGLNLKLQGGAAIEDGALRLTGKTGCLALSDTLPVKLAEKTLEVWVKCETLDQKAAGVFSVGPMTSNNGPFDAITFNQRAKGEWLACSDFFRRTHSFSAWPENVTGLVVHIAITYSKEGEITCFRNGQLYGTSYIAESSPKHFDGEDRGRVLFGCRHVWPHGQGPQEQDRDWSGVGFFAGRILAAAIYDWALSPLEIMVSGSRGRLELFPASGPRYIGPECEENIQGFRQEYPWTDAFLEIDTAARGMTRLQLQHVLKYVCRYCHRWDQGHRPEDVNLYILNEWLLIPATQGPHQASCSFVELVGCKSPPLWFVSHWWGETIASFISCLRKHGILRLLGWDVSYWICAYSNRQHELSEELPDDPKKTSFYKAISRSLGMLLILDAKSTPFQRIWCCFESVMRMEINDELLTGSPSEQGQQILFDVATVWKGKPYLLSDGHVESDKFDHHPAVRMSERHRGFPMHTLHDGMSVCFESAEASRWQDKRRILNVIAKLDVDTATPPHSHELYDKANARIRSKFALVAWRHCLVKKGPKFITELGLPSALKSDCELRAVSLDFSFLDELQDESLLQLAYALPAQLNYFSLDLEWCHMVTHLGVRALLFHLFHHCANLQHMTLNLRRCAGVERKEADALCKTFGVDLCEGSMDDANLVGSEEGFELVWSRCAGDQASNSALQCGMPDP